VSLQTRLAALISAIGTDIKTLQTRVPPAGGTTNQVLSKKTNTDYDTQWATQATASITMDTWHYVDVPAGTTGEPKFQNSWVNYDTTTYNAAGFRKSPDGRVALKGFIKAGISSVIFTLPAGYHPPKDIIWTGTAHNGTTYVPVDGRVFATGNVTIVNPPASATVWVSLESVEFDTESVLQTASVAAQPLEAWHTIGAAGEPTLGSGWSQVAGDTPIAFRKDINGRIAIKGMANAPAITANNFSVVFILPVGYRPPANTFPRFITIHALGSAMLRVESVTGEVRLYNTTGLTAPATGGIVALDVIEFDTETVSAYTSGVIGPQRVTVLPVGAIDGQEVYFVADATNGVLWHLRYNAASASAYKWEFVGGSPLVTESSPVGDESTASGTYVALSTPTTLVIPLAGDYDIETSCHGRSSVTGQVMMSYDVGATAAIDADAAGDASQTGGAGSLIIRRLKRKTIPTASVTLTVKYRTAATSTFTVFGAATIPGATRMIRATPVRVA
jgi:hypothetical protein